MNTFVFTPNSHEDIILSDGSTLRIKKCITSFARWRGILPCSTYGGKCMLDYEGEPVFAEIAVLRHLQKEGWNGVWVDTYRKKYRIGMPEITEPIDLPMQYMHMLEKIKTHGAKTGCWDVFAWKEKKVVFIELKRVKKDAIRQTQIQWLEASIAAGIDEADFLIVEWEPLTL